MAGLGNMGSVMTQKLYNSLSIGTAADFQLYTYLVCVVILALMLFIMSFVEKKKLPANTDAPSVGTLRGKVLVFIGIAILMMYVSQYLSTVSAGYIPSSVFYPLSYIISMPLIFLADVIIYKERITLRSIVGILLVIASGILVNLK